MMLVRLCHPGPRLKTYEEKCFQFAGPKEWNNLPLLIRESPSIFFYNRLKTYFFNNGCYRPFYIESNFIES